MRLLFKQRFFSWLDSYDVYHEDGTVAYTVKGQLSWGHCLRIFDPAGNYVGTVKERVFAWLPKFELYLGETYAGMVCKKWSWFRPKYLFECNDWSVEGDFFEWDYTIVSASRGTVAVIGKELLNWTDTYSLDIKDPADALLVLMFTLAIDAEKCSRN